MISEYNVIRNPISTEKSTNCSELGKYFFKVLPSATKLSVKLAVEKIFDVKVKDVNILNYKGKIKKFKGILGRRANFKKAIVTLEKDYMIDFSGGIK